MDEALRSSCERTLPAVLALILSTASHAQTDPLPSWNESAARRAIVQFVEDVTRESSPHFIAPADRIAVFDNDGTLWSEQPMYFQMLFALDRIRALAPQHPQWKDQQPFKAVIEGDQKALLASGETGIAQIVAASHAGMTTAEFEQIVTDWLRQAQHPRFHRPYTQLVYQPMLELLGYLRAHGFKTFIVSGGGIEFMRAWAGRVYGIPPQQVVGSTAKVQFGLVDGHPVLHRLAEVQFVDDGPGKPAGIHMHIGKRPVFAFGNSDGDQQMLEWTAAGSGRYFAGLVHHTDAQREWAYDRESHVGKLDKALDAADVRKWVIVDMKNDWAQIYPWEGAAERSTGPLNAK